MKYNCSNEFNLETIYQKLMSKSHAPCSMVKANNFFRKQSELEMLQEKMDGIMCALRKITLI